MKVHQRKSPIRIFSLAMFLFLLSFVPSVLKKGVFAVGADCSDGCDDCMDMYGCEYLCEGGTYCCTGHGCGSYACSQTGWNPMICSGEWTCCDYSRADCERCFDSYLYALAGTCDPCGGGDPGDPGSPSGTKWMVGRVWTDFNRNGTYTADEDWAPTSLVCSSNKSDIVQVKIDGVSQENNWACDPGGNEARYGFDWMGSGPYTFRLTPPTNYNCLNPAKITWSFTTVTSGAGATTSGNGCTTSITLGDENYLWWRLLPPAQPSVTVTPPSISYPSGDVVFPIKVAFTDEDVDGQTRISTSVPSGLGYIRPTGYIEFTAYGNRSNTGVWPIAKIYGWRKDTGERVWLSTVTIDSSTPKSFWINVNDMTANYSNLDFEFTNDIWDPATGTGTDIFIDSITFWTDDPGFGGVPYKVQAEDGSLVVYDRGFNSRDGYDTRDPGLTVVTTSGQTYTVMAWQGALRFPILWTSPSNAISGNITITVNDGVTGAVTKMIPVNPVPKTLTGKIWQIPEGAVVDNALCTARLGSGLPVTVTVNTTLPGSFSVATPDGNYTVTGITGSYTGSVNLTNLPPGSSYTVGCINSAPGSATGLNIPVSRIVTSLTPNVLDVGLKQVTAKKWVAEMGSDVYANNISMTLPKVTCPNPFTYLCPSFSDPENYVIGYGANSSSIFSGGTVPSVRLSESNVTATGVTNNFRDKNKQYFVKLKTLINNLRDSGLYTVITSVSYNTFSSLPGNGANSIRIFSPSYRNLSSSNVTYSTSSDGLVFLIVPKATGSDNSLYIDYNLVSSNSNRRLVILADRNIKIGRRILGTTDNPKTTAPHIMASIITTGDIEIVSYSPPSATSNTVIVEGSLISGKKLNVTRTQSPEYNELRPVLFVRFKPLFMTEFNKIAMNNLIPALNPIFTFDFSQEEED